MAGPEIRRLYYSSKEVSELVQVPLHILRLWETQFPQLKPSKSKSGRRLYKQKDLDTLFEIKKLMNKGYTDEKVSWMIDHQIDHPQRDPQPEQMDQTETILPVDQSRRMVLLFEMMNGLNEILHILDEK